MRIFPEKRSDGAFVERLRKQYQRRQRWRWFHLGLALCFFGLAGFVFHLVYHLGWFPPSGQAARLALHVGAAIGFFAGTIVMQGGQSVGAFIGTFFDDRKDRLLLNYHDRMTENKQ